jgi:hypothetical protein
MVTTIRAMFMVTTIRAMFIITTHINIYLHMYQYTHNITKPMVLYNAQKNAERVRRMFLDRTILPDGFAFGERSD